VLSLHAGWALALGVGVVSYGRNVLVHAADALYPAAVLLTILLMAVL
jgi:hypothetical protein